MATTGKIPKNLKYYCKQRDVTVDGVSVYPTFVVNADSESMCETARSWARVYDWQTQQVSDPIISVYSNEPIKNVVITGLEKRSEGGRAYKVIFDQGGTKYYVDLREDVMVDVIKNCGIKAGGILIGEFVWCQFGSQMKLVRIGSELYNTVKISDSKGSAKKIQNSDLVIGHVYESHSGNRSVYLGKIKTTRLFVEGSLGDKIYLGKKPIEPHLYWLEIPSWVGDEEAHLKQCIEECDTPFYFKLTKSHSFRVDGGKVFDSFDMEDHLVKIRRSAVEITKREESRWSEFWKHHLETVIHFSEAMNLVKADHPHSLNQYIIDWMEKNKQRVSF